MGKVENSKLPESSHQWTVGDIFSSFPWGVGKKKKKRLTAVGIEPERSTTSLSVDFHGFFLLYVPTTMYEGCFHSATLATYVSYLIIGFT